MSTDLEVRTQPRGDFGQRLERLRIRIESLPETQRPHLLDLAETIARQHEKLQDRAPHRYDAD